MFGNPPEVFIPTMILNGENIAIFVPEALRQAGSTGAHRLVGATWTPNGVRAAMHAGFRDITNTTHPAW